VEKSVKDEQSIRQFLKGMYGARGPKGELAFVPEKGVVVENLPVIGESKILNGKVSDTVSCRFHLARRSIKMGEKPQQVDHNQRAGPRRTAIRYDHFLSCERRVEAEAVSKKRRGLMLSIDDGSAMSSVVGDHGKEVEKRANRPAGLGTSITLYVSRVPSGFIKIAPHTDDDDRCWTTTSRSTRNTASTPRVSPLPHL
jgi:hypothetical protein